MAKTFKIGDIVKLKSGGELIMTVTKVSGLAIYVVWSKSAKQLAEKILPSACLELAEKNDVKIITGMTIT